MKATTVAFAVIAFCLVSAVLATEEGARPFKLLSRRQMNEHLTSVITERYETRRTEVLSGSAIAPRAACSTHTSSCACVAETDQTCVWIIGADISDPENPKLGGMCVDGTSESGPSGESMNMFEGCWWPQTAEMMDIECTGDQCNCDCVWRMELAFITSGIYMRMEISINPNAQFDPEFIQTFFESISFKVFMTMGGGGIFGGVTPIPIYTGSVYMKSEPVESGLGDDPNAVVGFRAAAFFLMMESWFNYSTTTYPDGVTAEDVAGMTLGVLTDTSLTGGNAPAADITEAFGTVYLWTISSSSHGVDFTYKCYFSDQSFQLASMTEFMDAYGNKCDLEVATNGNAPDGFGLRTIVAASQSTLTLSSDESSSENTDLTFGAAAVKYATTVEDTDASTSYDVKISSPDICTGDLSGSSWFTDATLQTNVEDQAGEDTAWGCTYITFHGSGVNNYYWDPQSQVDKQKADSLLGAAGATGVSTVTVFAGLVVALIALVF